MQAREIEVGVAFPASVPVLKIYKGDTFNASFVLKSNDEPIDFVAQGWTTWTAQWRETKTATASVPFIVDASQSNIGRIKITMTAMNTRSVKKGYWDIQAIRGEEVKTWLRGDVLTDGDVTRGS